jgi:hypothetical protein
MSFNYRAYLKNNILLQEEFPRDKWVNLSDKEKGEYADDIFNLINTAYAPIGGNVNYKSAADVLGAEADADYEVINIDDDPEIDAVSAYKKQPAGNKLAAIGHDGSPIAKSKIINHYANLLKQKGYYLEVSGKLKDILLTKGAPVVTDPEIIKKVLKGKEVKMNDDGTYERYLAGECVLKLCLEIPFRMILDDISSAVNLAPEDIFRIFTA